ncbi:MAG: hypothetical protein JXR94_06295, partial [Candidatus Hydrogenedentes bacterium]|nr:hypothetical protein [Candidatus Hydrogenedentota bacterium]
EPLRSHPQAAQARAIMGEQGFPAALRFVSAERLAYVRTKPHVDPLTEAFHAWLCSPEQS